MTKYVYDRLEFFVLAAATLATLIILIWLLNYSHYGLDLTDESYYLIWMANPWVYPVSVTQFGFIYHPLNLLLQGDISLLRQANVLIIFSLAWILCLVFFKTTINLPKEQTLSGYKLKILGLAAITATCSLIYFCPFGWLATPSYNSLIFQALLLTSIGLLLAEKTISPMSFLGWILIGVGGWLAFMAKPTSAAALGLLISICLPLTNKFNISLLAISLLTVIVLLISYALVIDGSLITFIERLKSGIEDSSLMESGHSISETFRVDYLLIGKKEQLLLAFFSIVIFGTIYLAVLEKKLLVIIMFVIILSATTSIVIISNYFSFEVNNPYSSHSPLLILAVPLSACGFFLIFRLACKLPKIQWGIVCYFTLLPHVLAFGTNNNYWLQGSLGSLFWVLAGLVILIPIVLKTNKLQILLATAMSAQLITVFLLYAAMEHPYFGQPEPFRQYSDIIDINKSTLILPQNLADYYRNIKKMGDQTGFQADTPMIDMTGHSPGVLYAMGAKAIGAPWLIGGYSGSNNLAVSQLNRVSCVKIISSWLIVDPDSPAKLSPTILHNFGISFENNFEMAAELAVPSTNVARWGVPIKRLQLWKPKHLIQQTLSVCEKKRNSL